MEFLKWLLVNSIYLIKFDQNFQANNQVGEYFMLPTM